MGSTFINSKQSFNQIKQFNNDYKEGVRRNSINKDNPFYLYYQNISQK